MPRRPLSALMFAALLGVGCSVEVPPGERLFALTPPPIGWSRATPNYGLSQSVVYDAARGRLLVLQTVVTPYQTGAFDIPFATAFDFDGTRWIPIDPQSGIAPAVAYDSDRARTVLFGGISFNVHTPQSSRGDTIEFDGHGWSTVAKSGPPHRYGARLAYDAARHRSVLFGGLQVGPMQDDRFLDDTWEWDGTTWTEAHVAGPPARYLSAMAWDGSRKRVVLFGGGKTCLPQNCPVLGDTWEWDGVAWNERIGTGPAPRSSAAMTYDVARQRVVLFGGWGWDGKTLFAMTDTWEWDGTHWIATAPPASPGALAGSLVFDGAIGRTVLAGLPANAKFPYYGGPELWDWDGTTWTRRVGGPPPPRSFAAMAYDAAREKVVLFGGLTDNDTSGPLLDDTWEWDGGTWRRVATGGPAARTGHAMAYDAARKVIVLHGGSTSRYDNGESFADTWEWNGVSWTLRATSGPPARAAHAMAYDAIRKVTVIHGGAQDAEGLSWLRGDTWEWDGTNWHDRTGPGPGPRANAAMAFDASAGRIRLAGGTGSPPPSDTWEWDGVQWTLLAIHGPAGWPSKMVWDDRRGRLLFLGADGMSRWNGAGWTLESDSPPLKWGVALAYDGARGELLAFGGYSIGYSSDYTWRYWAPLPPSADAGLAAVDLAPGVPLPDLAALRDPDASAGGAPPSPGDGACSVRRVPTPGAAFGLWTALWVSFTVLAFARSTRRTTSRRRDRRGGGPHLPDHRPQLRGCTAAAKSM